MRNEDNSVRQSKRILPLGIDQLKLEGNFSLVAVGEASLVGRNQARPNAVDASLHRGVLVRRDHLWVDSQKQFAGEVLFCIGIYGCGVVVIFFQEFGLAVSNSARTEDG